MRVYVCVLKVTQCQVMRTEIKGPRLIMSEVLWSDLMDVWPVLYWRLGDK